MDLFSLHATNAAGITWHIKSHSSRIKDMKSTIIPRTASSRDIFRVVRIIAKELQKQKMMDKASQSVPMIVLQKPYQAVNNFTIINIIFCLWYDNRGIWIIFEDNSCILTLDNTEPISIPQAAESTQDAWAKRTHHVLSHSHQEITVDQQMVLQQRF
ncbi:hypothetical protein BDR06DRAFT_968239 [Suillus hirtellus]|nr:hypothetical protein BDR06DRAFT_968239 [Suillus hirtellus]